MNNEAAERVPQKRGGK